MVVNHKCFDRSIQTYIWHVGLIYKEPSLGFFELNHFIYNHFVCNFFWELMNIFSTLMWALYWLEKSLNKIDWLSIDGHINYLSCTLMCNFVLGLAQLPVCIYMENCCCSKSHMLNFFWPFVFLLKITVFCRWHGCCMFTCFTFLVRVWDEFYWEPHIVFYLFKWQCTFQKTKKWNGIPPKIHTKSHVKACSLGGEQRESRGCVAPFLNHTRLHALQGGWSDSGSPFYKKGGWYPALPTGIS